MVIKYRTIERADKDAFAAWLRANGRAFGSHPEDFTVEDHPGALDLFEFERSLAAYDGDEVVGTALAYTFDMTVPGGFLPTAGVAGVGVQPTHRRRGVLTGMMRTQLDDIRERGEPLAALWASESVIYGRFGYGLASLDEYWKIDRDHAMFRAPVPFSGRVRMALGPEAAESMPAVWDEARRQRNGMMTRTPPNWLARVDNKKSFYAIHEDEGGQPHAYAVYEIENKWDYGAPQSILKVQELVAADSDAEIALWSFLFGVDLIGTIEAQHRPVDATLPWLLADPRRLQRGVSDALWLRIIDVEKALGGRTYAVVGELTIDIRDTFCPWVEGVYKLEVASEGATCKRSPGAADLTMSAVELGAIYLGGVKPSTLGRAGRIEENKPGALAQADAMFATALAPWAAHHF